MADIPIGDLRVASADFLVETLLRLQKELRELRAERDHAVLYADTYKAEADQFRDAAKMVQPVGDAWHLDESEASLLHGLTSPDDDEHSPLTLRVGHVREDDGTVKFGLLCEYTEYPEEGATLLVERAAAPQPLNEVPMPKATGFSTGTIFAENRCTGQNIAKGTLLPLREWYAVESVRTYGDAREAAGYAAGVASGGKDAERYRWLRENGHEAIGADRGCGPEWIYGVELDALIDAALRGEVKP